MNSLEVCSHVHYRKSISYISEYNLVSYKLYPRRNEKVKKIIKYVLEGIKSKK